MLNQEGIDPCPCCGASAVVQDGSNGDDGGYYIECSGCGLSTVLMYPCGEDPLPILKEKWNRRVKVQTPPAGFEVVFVSGFDDLIESIHRGMRKGFLPDSIQEYYDAFDFRKPT